MKKRIVSLLVACVLIMLCGCDKIPMKAENPTETQESTPAREPETPQGPVTVEGPGFDSPEEAILAYAKALQKGDVQEILSTFAVETYVENFDLTAWIDNSGAYTIAGSQPIPSADDYTMGLNLVARQYEITRNLTNMYLTLGKVENFVSPITFNGDPYDKPSELVDDMVIYNWMDMLAGMEIGDILDCEAVGHDPINMNRVLWYQLQYLRCEELVPLALELTIDGESYCLCVDVARYGEKWYNCDPFGTLAFYLGADALSGGLYPLEN